MVDVGLLLLGVLVGGGVVTGGLAVYGWRGPPNPARVPFVGMMVTLTLWVWGYAWALTVDDPAARLTAQVVADLPSGFLPVWWVLFALGYAGRNEYVDWRVFAVLSIVPTGVAVLSLATAPSDLVYAGYAVHRHGSIATVTFDLTAFFLAYLVYVFLVIGVGAALIFRVSLRYDDLFSEQAVSVLVATLFPSVASLLWVVGAIPVTGLRATPFTVPVIGLAYGNALFRHRLLDIGPATTRIGRNEAIQHLPDGVVVLDVGGRIADCNRTIERDFDCERAQVVGEPLESVIGASAADLVGAPTTLELDAADGRRRFEVRSSVVTDGSGGEMGHALVVRDVTRRELREQRLEVLNRVLRHNLRNDVTVVDGYVERLAERADDPEAAERVRGATADLIGLSRKAQEVARAMDQADHTEVVDVADLVDNVLRDVGADDGRVAVDVPGDLALATNEQVLELVLTNLVENALQHAGPDPAVSVSARRLSGGVEFQVCDDGPGIPDSELSVIEAESETPLQHGSGLGLWVVAWGTEWVGGDVTFDRDGGTTATVVVPDRDSDATGTDDTGVEGGPA